jgi:hypothetical protein
VFLERLFIDEKNFDMLEYWPCSDAPEATLVLFLRCMNFHKTLIIAMPLMAQIIYSVDTNTTFT